MARFVKPENLALRNALTQQRVRELFKYDLVTGTFVRRVRIGKEPAGKIVGTVFGPGYLLTRIDRVPYLLHRLAWLYVTGSWPAEEIDHRNGDRGDNHWNNLRQATHAQNNWNKRPAKNGADLKGAFRARNCRWRSQIKQHGKLYWLGNFDSAEEAHAAYCVAADRLHGEFARTK